MKLPETLSARLAAGLLPPALLLTGAGREAAAQHLAQIYLCSGAEKPCGLCVHCRKLRQSIHPDLIRAEEVKVENIRALRADAHIRPNEAERKIYLFPRAEQLNPQAQNALLKLVEEGPPYAVFFFLCAQPESLLVTLRSRCEQHLIAAQEPEREPLEEAVALIALLGSKQKSQLPLLQLCVLLEKKSREELAAILNETIDGLLPCAMRQPTLLPLLVQLQELRDTCTFNISPGHLVGRLMTLTQP